MDFDFLLVQLAEQMGRCAVKDCELHIMAFCAHQRQDVADKSFRTTDAERRYDVEDSHRKDLALWRM